MVKFKITISLSWVSPTIVLQDCYLFNKYLFLYLICDMYLFNLICHGDGCRNSTTAEEVSKFQHLFHKSVASHEGHPVTKSSFQYPHG